MNKHNLTSIEYKFREGKDFSALSELRNGKDKVPETIKLLFTKVEDYDLINFFNENGFEYQEIVSVKVNGDKTGYKNKLGELVEAPSDVEVTFKTKDGKLNTWKMNDYEVNEEYKIWSSGVPFADEYDIDVNIGTNWRAYMLARFGMKEYGEMLQAQLAFEGYEKLPTTVISGKTKGEKVAKYQRDEMRKIVRLARDVQKCSPSFDDVRKTREDNISAFFETMNR